MKRAINKASEENATVTQTIGGNSVLQELLKQKKDETIHIDMEKRLQEVCLKSMTMEVLPSGALVDELATKIDKMKKKGIAKSSSHNASSHPANAPNEIER